MTTHELYGPAMLITDQAEADAYFEKLVANSMHYGYDREQAEACERSNLAYYAGYHSNQCRRRVEKLFDCAHPVFGSIAQNGPPTTEAAFEAGRKMGEAARNKSG